MNNVAKVQDYPDLIKKGGAVINVNATEHSRAIARARNSGRIDRLEKRMDEFSDSLDTIISLLQGNKS